MYLKNIKNSEINKIKKVNKLVNLNELLSGLHRITAPSFVVNKIALSAWQKGYKKEREYIFLIFYLSGLKNLVCGQFQFWE